MDTLLSLNTPSTSFPQGTQIIEVSSGFSVAYRWDIIEEASFSNNCIDKYKLWLAIIDANIFDDYKVSDLLVYSRSNTFVYNSFMQGYSGVDVGRQLGYLRPAPYPLNPVLGTSNSGYMNTNMVFYTQKICEFWFHRSNPDISPITWLSTQPDNLVYGSWIHHYSVPFSATGLIFPVDLKVYDERWSGSPPLVLRTYPLDLSLSTFTTPCTSPVIIPPPTPDPTPFPVPLPAPTGLVLEKPLLNFRCVSGNREQTPSLIPNHFINDINLPAVQNANLLEDGFPKWFSFDSCNFLHRLLGTFGHYLNITDEAVKVIGSRRFLTEYEYEYPYIHEIDVPKTLLESKITLGVSGHVVPEVNVLEFESAQGLCFTKVLTENSLKYYVKNLNRVYSILSSTGQIFDIPDRDTSFKCFYTLSRYTALQSNRWFEIEDTSYFFPSGEIFLSYVKKDFRSAIEFSLTVDSKPIYVQGVKRNNFYSIDNLLKYRGISLPSSSTKETKKEVLLNWERNKNFPERELSLYRIATDLNLVNYGSLYKSNVPISGTLLISPELQPAYIEERLQNNTFSKKTVTYSKVDDVLGVSVVNGLVTGDVISAVVPHYSVSGTTLIPSNTIEETIYLSFYDKLTITNVINLSRNRLITNNRPSILLMDIFNSLNFLKGYTYGKALWASAILDVKQESSLSLNFED